jgi:hypothetical protein
VLFLTALVSQAESRDPRFGMDRVHYLPKPVDIDDLMQHIDLVIGVRARRPRRRDAGAVVGGAGAAGPAGVPAAPAGATTAGGAGGADVVMRVASPDA